MNIKRFCAWILATALSIGIAGAAPVGESVDRAQAAATSWLSLVDSAEFGRSWSQAANTFKSAVPEAQWVSTVRGVRAPLGPVVSRKLKSATFTASLPGAPPGKYVVLQYTTDFSNRADAVETVTFMLDGGAWRAAGYYIR
jgi:hypothetical protein